MRVVCVGGGSGGHVTPVLAVINELSVLDAELNATFICDKSFEAQSRGLMKHAAVPVSIHAVIAGKLRRYHSIPWWKQLLDIPTLIKNIRDIFLVGAGIVQSLVLLMRSKPDVVFAKGGYVCLPIGYAAHLLRIPLVIHDSDTRPGLTNRILSRWAVRIATGAPLQNYTYPKDISTYTGVPIDAEFHPFSAEEQYQAKRRLGIKDVHKPLLVVTGGGLGARTINNAVVTIAPQLLSSGIGLYHITGRRDYEKLHAQAVSHPEYQLVPFIYKDMALVLGAADIVIARGSATFLQELAALKKPVIIVPAEHLSDQVRNAQVFEEAEAALVLTDAALMKHPRALFDAVMLLINEPAEASHIAAQLHEYAKPNAAKDVAVMIADVCKRQYTRVEKNSGTLS